MSLRHTPAGIPDKLSRYFKSRAKRRFRPVVLGMEQRLLLAGMPTTIYVSSTNTLASDNIPVSTPVTPFRTIQHAIDYAEANANTVSSDYVIDVQAGSYNTAVDLAISVANSLNLTSLMISGGYNAAFTTQSTDPSQTVFTPQQASSNNNTYDVSVSNPNTTIDDFTFDFGGQTGTRPSGGILAASTNFVLNNNVVNIGTNGTGGSGRADGVQVASTDTSGLTITNNIFDAAQEATTAYADPTEGIFLNPSPSANSARTTISGNTFTGTNLASGIVDKSDSMVDILNNTFTRPSMSQTNYFPLIDLRSATSMNRLSDVTVVGNVINGGNATTGNFGIFVGEDNPANPISNIQILNNFITGNGVGVAVSPMATAVVLTGNSIAGNSVAGLSNTGGSVVDASANWWGSASGPKTFDNPNGTGDAISDGKTASTGANSISYVDYTPWFDSGTDTDTDTLGFQGDYSQLTVTSGGAQSAGLGRVQEGISLVTTGGTVNVQSGTYGDPVTVNKAITLIGAGGTTAVSGTDASAMNPTVLNFATQGGGVLITSSNVTLEGFDIKGDGSTVYGVYVQGNANNLTNDTISDNYIHGMANARSYGILADANVNNSTYGTLSGLAITGNSIYTIGAGSSGAGGFGISTNEVVQGTSPNPTGPGSGLSVTKNDFDSILDGATTSNPALVGIAVSAGRTTGDNTYLENPTSGVLVQGNTYSNTTVGAFLDSKNSLFDEKSALFITNVPDFLINAGRYATVNTTDLGKYAMTNDPAVLDSLEKGLAAASDAYTAAIQTAINGTGTDPNPRVNVSADTFTEVLTIPRSLTIVGSSGTNLQVPTGSTAQSVVTITGANTNVEFVYFVVYATDSTGNTTIPYAILVNGGAIGNNHDNQYHSYGTAGVFATGSGTQALVGTNVIAGTANTSGVIIGGGAYGQVTGGNYVVGNQYGVELLSDAAAKSNVTGNNFSRNGAAVFDESASASAISGNMINYYDPSASQSGIVIDGTGTATIAGNTITQTMTGIVVQEGTVIATGNTITGGTVGISAVASSDGSSPVSLTAGDSTAGDGNTITGYVSSGINVSGSDASATIDGNTITGLGSSATAAQVGIAISGGATATIGNSANQNTITNNSYSDSNGASVGIELAGAAASTTVTYNNVNADSIGIESTGTVSPTSISDNDINSGKVAGSIGILVSSGGTTTVDANRIQGAAVGIETNSTDASSTATISKSAIVGYDFAGSVGVLNTSAGTVTIASNGIYGGVGTPIVVNSTGTTTINANTINGYSFYNDPNTNSPYSFSATDIEVDNGTVTIGDGTSTNSNTITGYKRTGIFANGSGVAATINDNTITGVGSMATAGEFGIFVAGGAVGTVAGNTISNNLTSSTQNTNSVGIYLNGAASSTVTGNILDNNDIAIASGGPAAIGSGTTAQPITTTISGNKINTGTTSTGSFGISNSSDGTTTINGNTIGAVSVDGITSNTSVGSTTIENDTITNSGYAGIEVDNGTVGVMNEKITGGQYGIYAVSNSSNVTVNLTNTQITNANVGLRIDSTRASGAHSSTVNVEDAATTVTNTSNPNAHGVEFDGTKSFLNTYAPPMFQTAAAPTLTNNPDGTYNASIPFAAIDNITSMNDLKYAYKVDNGTFGTPTTMTSPLVLSNLSNGQHTITIEAINQGTETDTTKTTMTETVIISNVPTNFDGSFETPVVGNGNFQYSSQFATDSTSPPWDFEGNSGISGNNSGFTSGNQPAPDGAQVAILQTTGYFSQALTFGATGNFVMTFDAAQRANISQPGQDFEVLITNSNGTVLDEKFTPSSTNYQAFTSTVFTIATAGSYTVEFKGLDDNTGDNTAFIDAIAFNAAVTAATTPMVPDGSFESPIVGNGNFEYGSQFAGASPWDFEGNSGISGNNSGFTSGNSNAPDGAQVAILQTTGYFSQVVDFGTSGANYVITFSAAQRGNLQQNGQNFEVLIDDNVIGMPFTPASASYQKFTTASFSVTGKHTVEFLGLDFNGGDNTAFIDNIAVAVVPANPAPAVPDGSFETPSVAGQPGRFVYDPVVNNDTTSANYNPWTFTGNSGIAANGSGFTGSQAAPDGSQVAFLQNGDGTYGTTTDAGSSYFSQAVNFANTGNYAINFLAAERANFGTQDQSFTVLILDSTGNVVSTKTFQPGSTSYSPLSESFIIGMSGTYTILFVGQGASSGDATSFIDNITIANA